MSAPIIETPKGKIVLTENGRAELVWNTKFQRKWYKQYSDAQKFVDSEVKRLSEPYTPLRAGILIMSAILGTDEGSGMVAWIVPYAKRQYYKGRKPGTSQTGPLRGRFWFARMKAVSGQSIIAGARKIAATGAK